MADRIAALEKGGGGVVEAIGLYFTITEFLCLVHVKLVLQHVYNHPILCQYTTISITKQVLTDSFSISTNQSSANINYKLFFAITPYEHTK